MSTKYMEENHKTLSTLKSMMLRNRGTVSGTEWFLGFAGRWNHLAPSPSHSGVLGMGCFPGHPGFLKHCRWFECALKFQNHQSKVFSGIHHPCMLGSAFRSQMNWNGCPPDGWPSWIPNMYWVRAKLQLNLQDSHYISFVLPWVAGINLQVQGPRISWEQETSHYFCPCKKIQISHSAPADLVQSHSISVLEGAFPRP